MIRLRIDESLQNSRGILVNANPVNNTGRVSDYFKVSIRDICKQIWKEAAHEYNIGASHVSHGNGYLTFDIQIGYSSLLDIYIDLIKDQVKIIYSSEVSKSTKPIQVKAAKIVERNIWT